MNMKDWHALEIPEVLQHLNTNGEQGLPDSEVTLRLAESGPNELVERGRRSVWRILW